MFEILIYGAVALLVILVPAWYWNHERKKSKRANAILTKAIESGRDQPVSLHPVIDPDICIGSGACVRACPEQNVLGLINNAGKLINPGNCIGHGMCQAACPVDAITLVFGTEKRGVDIPHVSGRFETNVKGVYIAGELGGMGLIRNATTQGIQAAGYIAESLHEEKERKSDRIYDLVIVGAGPAGIGAALKARQEKLDFIILDQQDLGGTVLTYPRRKLVMTRPMELPGYGKVNLREVQKEKLMDLFQDVFSKADLSVYANEKVTEVVRDNGNFKVVTGSSNEYRAKRVLLSIGRRGSPRKLGVPGETSSRVSYLLLDPEKYKNMNILVVGGGDSAVEAAVSLSEQPGNTVHLSYRRDSIFRIKEGNKERLEKAVNAGSVKTIYSSNVVRIDDDQVVLEKEGEEIVLTNDQVFIFAGGEMPTEFLNRVGIEFTRKFGEA